MELKTYAIRRNVIVNIYIYIYIYILVFTVNITNLQNTSNSLSFFHVNCAFIWVKIQFRYMFRLFMKPSSSDTFYKLKLLRCICI
jgi:hypothetical protein